MEEYLCIAFFDIKIYVLFFVLKDSRFEMTLDAKLENVFTNKHLPSFVHNEVTLSL